MTVTTEKIIYKILKETIKNTETEWPEIRDTFENTDIEYIDWLLIRRCIAKLIEDGKIIRVKSIFKEIYKSC